MIFKEYFKDEIRTKENITDDGWFKTGDIAELLPNGGIKIIDRIKSIFKLSQGEFISPEKVEKFYAKVRGVEEVALYGESTKDYWYNIIYYL